MSSLTQAVEVAHVGTLATLVGTVAVDPTAPMRSAPDWSGWLAGQQRIDRVMSRVAPPLFISTAVAAAVAGLVAASRRQAPLAAGRLVATACIGAAIAVTLKVNEPLNERIRTWQPADQPPEDWRAARAAWNRAHGYRRALLVAAALASSAGWATTRGRQSQVSG